MGRSFQSKSKIMNAHGKLTITAGEAAYSNIYGAVLPPMLSLAALLASLAYLSKSIKTRT